MAENESYLFGLLILPNERKFLLAIFANSNLFIVYPKNLKHETHSIFHHSSISQEYLHLLSLFDS